MGRVPISYRDYYDVPRIFVAKWHRKLFLFDCLFDDQLDDYPDHFLVYELPTALAKHLAERSWVGLANEARYIGRVAVNDVSFPFKHSAPVQAIRRTPIAKHRTDPMGGFHPGWIDDRVFEKLNLD